MSQQSQARPRPTPSLFAHPIDLWMRLRRPRRVRSGTAWEQAETRKAWTPGVWGLWADQPTVHPLVAGGSAGSGFAVTQRRGRSRAVRQAPAPTASPAPVIADAAAVDAPRSQPVEVVEPVAARLRSTPTVAVASSVASSVAPSVAPTLAVASSPAVPLQRAVPTQRGSSSPEPSTVQGEARP